MAAFYDEIEIEDFVFDEGKKAYTYPCPCGDKFVISKEDLMNGEEVARCPSCSLIIRVIYDPEDFQPTEEEAQEETEAPKPLEASNEIAVA
eukprot:TRINITY_DN9158_c0_g1_i1.p2 TRINITY_DN9158_c0_g1~~TRINITY_DN9158_c0_g1_i1.p2  ORF type:complete len:100 (-),score=23.59 TRINITY_DN9158_c0_g1_i1:588-860(-)